jgi:hypothetical protein
VHDALSSIAEPFDELVHRLVREECSTRGARCGYIELYSTTVGRTQIRAMSYSYHRSQLSGNAELQYFSEMGSSQIRSASGPSAVVDVHLKQTHGRFKAGARSRSLTSPNIW